MVMGLDFDEDIRSNFVQRLKNKMADYNLKVIYLASPPNVSLHVRRVLLNPSVATQQWVEFKYSIYTDIRSRH